MGRIKDKLKDVSDRFENAGLTGGGEDAKVVSELMDVIQNTVADCQVSRNPQPGTVI
jgi:hypothetical protein